MHNTPQNTRDQGTYWSAMLITGLLLALVAFVFAAQTPAEGSTGTITEGNTSDVQITSVPPVFVFSAADNSVVDTRIDQLMHAIQQQESPGEDDPTRSVGDGGDSIGPYHIQNPYYIDAVWQMNRDGTDTSDFEYKMVRQWDFAEQVMLAYWKRWNPKDLNIVLNARSSEQDFIDAAVRLSRIHNGGPKGHLKRATIGYGNRVRKLLTE